jgi:hypothetical protein
MKITAHILIKNEDRFIWYSVMSILNYVDRVRIWDIGSSDKTAEIVKIISKTKEAKKKDLFDFRQLGDVDFNEKELRQTMFEIDEVDDLFTAARYQMLSETVAPWILVVDGDEIWWDASIAKVTEVVRNNNQKFESIVVPTVNLVGDMFNYQEKQAGRYHLAGRVGHYNLRAINRKIPGLHAKGEHGVFGWADKDGVMIENRDGSGIKYIDSPYLHATHLRRSSFSRGDDLVYKRHKKLKHEIGTPFPNDFYYPEVFFRDRPDIVSSPWEPMSSEFKFRAFFETPLRKIYRRSFLRFKKHGY